MSETTTKPAEPLTREHVEQAIAAIHLLLAGVAAALPEGAAPRGQLAGSIKRGLNRAGEAAEYWMEMAAREIERGEECR